MENMIHIRTKEARFPTAPELYGLFFEDINHAADGRHDPDGFFCYMKERALEKDSTWNEDTRVNVEERIRQFLDDWTKLADQVPEETRRKIVDLS